LRWKCRSGQGMGPGEIPEERGGMDARSCATHPDFDDGRDIQRTIIQSGLTLTAKADDSTMGPASLMLVDREGGARRRGAEWGAAEEIRPFAGAAPLAVDGRMQHSRAHQRICARLGVLVVGLPLVE
jgi:hypothetical protein